MQINNNYNSQIGFKSVVWESLANGKTKASAKEVLSKRLPSGEFAVYVGRLEERFKKSPIEVKFGFADVFGDRLDAQLSYGETNSDNFVYVEERCRDNFFRIKPLKFLKNVEAEFGKLETKLGLGEKI